jgi:hypothetical protein
MKNLEKARPCPDIASKVRIREVTSQNTGSDNMLSWRRRKQAGYSCGDVSEVRQGGRCPEMPEGTRKTSGNTPFGGEARRIFP